MLSLIVVLLKLVDSARVLSPSTMLAPCDFGYFPCNNSEICVKQKLNCDGNKDCPDGSDELMCEDSHQREYYNNLFRKRPDEDREKLKQVNCLLAFIPDKCSCFTSSLFCEHRNLYSVPKELPQQIEELDLSGNHLLQLSQSSFPKIYNKLTTLILTSAEIVSIETKSFRTMTNLEYLYISGNSISTVRSRTFQNNHVLKLLVLSHNPISHLEPLSFIGLSNLTELDLRNCQLKDLPSQIFDPLKSLQILWLDGNQLTILPNDVFSSLQLLETLSLSRNQIQYVESDIFWGLDSLRTLTLATNSLTYIGESSFGYLNALLKL